MSTVGGEIQGAANQILAVNMFPFGAPNDADILSYWRKQASDGLADGKTYRDGLVLLNRNLDDGSAVAKMLQEDGLGLNYETVGLLGDSFNKAESQLIQAKNTFAYQLYLGYPSADKAKLDLMDAVRTLANLYLMIGDEFLVDALEWRFSANTVGLDNKLDEQIALLVQAQAYYEKGFSLFVSGFSPALGTNIYVSDYFGDSEYGLFNLFAERLGLTIRERSSKQLARQMGPDPTEQWSGAWPEASETAKSGALSIYLAAAAAAQKRGPSFNNADADNALTNTLAALLKQGNIYDQRLNPLGYDNRYIPATRFEDLYEQANTALERAIRLNTQFDSESRQFDYLQSSLKSQWNGLANEYINRLSLYTGCQLPNPLTDAAKLDSFRICTGEAGNDLFDCRLSLDSGQFSGCVDSKKTTGILASKYKNISAAQLQLDAAILNRDNILKRIEYENELASQKITLQNQSANSQIASLEQYLEKLKGARKIVNTSATLSGRWWNKDTKKWEDKPKERDYKTEDSFVVVDDALRLDIQRAEDLQRITLSFAVQEIDAETQNKVKNLLLDEAAAEIAIKLAIQQKNSAIADFDNTLQEKENLWQLYQRGLAQALPDSANVAPVRILRSQSAIALADALNRAAHYFYLSAKALEYKYVRTIENMPDVYKMSISDIFKAQTTDDFEDIRISLDSLNRNQCSWGYGFSLKQRDISIKDHVLGLNEAEFKTFIGDHINENGDLQFAFSISEDASFLRFYDLYNVKIWEGQLPCNSPSTAKGIAVGISADLSNYPTVHLKQSGHSSLRDKGGDIHQYIPISDFHFLFESAGDNYLPSTEDIMTAFQLSPRTDGGVLGDWSPNFKGRSLASSNWEITVYKDTVQDLRSINDITLYVDTITQCCVKK